MEDLDKEAKNIKQGKPTLPGFEHWADRVVKNKDLKKDIGKGVKDIEKGVKDVKKGVKDFSKDVKELGQDAKAVKNDTEAAIKDVKTAAKVCSDVAQCCTRCCSPVAQALPDTDPSGQSTAFHALSCLAILCAIHPKRKV